MCALTDVLSKNGGMPPGECFPLKGSHLHTKKMPRGQYATASTVEGGGGGEGGGEVGGGELERLFLHRTCSFLCCRVE